MSLAELLVTPLGWMLRAKRSDPARSVAFAAELSAEDSLELSSSSFAEGAPIPKTYSGIPRGRNTSPALSWRGIPAGARSLLLIIEDVDVPFARPLIHTIALIEPGESDSGELAEGAMTPGNLAVHYVPAFRGWLGYQGPRPFPGHGVHHYGFHLYALDIELDAHAFADLDALLPHVAGHVLVSGVLVGTQRA